VNRRIWLSGGLAYTHGGKVEVDGFEAGSAQTNFKGIASAGFRLWKGSTGIISYNHTLSRPDGASKEGPEAATDSDIPGELMGFLGRLEVSLRGLSGGWSCADSHQANNLRSSVRY